MNTNRSALIVAVAAAFLLLLGGTASADSCVWSHELQRWVCVPP